MPSPPLSGLAPLELYVIQLVDDDPSSDQICLQARLSPHEMAFGRSKPGPVTPGRSAEGSRPAKYRL